MRTCELHSSAESIGYSQVTSLHPRWPPTANCKRLNVRSGVSSGSHQHPPPAEAHHADAALEHEAVQVGRGHLQLQSLGAVHAVCLLGLPVGVVHPLHVLPQLVLPLEGGARKRRRRRRRRRTTAFSRRSKFSYSYIVCLVSKQDKQLTLRHK